MNDPRYRREVLFIQLAGELDALMTRAEALGPHLESLGDKVRDGVEFYDKRIADAHRGSADECDDVHSPSHQGNRRCQRA